MKKLSGATYLAIISTIIIAVAVVAAVIILDPPGVQRKRRIDVHRVEDLTNISNSIDIYWERKKSLPPNIAVLEAEPGLKIPLKDPETGNPYVYAVTGSKSYRLCAVFSVDSSEESGGGCLSRTWSHGAGRQCFELKPPKEK
jgi:hypothetical protein